MSREPVKSAVRALEILKLFSEERRELNQKEIIGRLHYPQSSASTQRVQEGGSLPLTWSAYGCVLLSRESDAQMDRVVRLINAREPDPAYKVNVGRMTAMLREVRANSMFYMVNPRMNGGAAVATLLPVNIAGRSVSIGVGGDCVKVEPRRDEITRSLADTLAAYRADLIATFCEERQFAMAA